MPKSKPSKNKKNQVIILGSGTSAGVPMVGCNCVVCQSQNSKNQRQRASIFLRTKKNVRILVDTTPDLRRQILDNHIEQVDATIITHEHSDHIQGMDDLRPFCFGKKPKIIPIFTSSRTKKILHERFPYIFTPHPKNKPVLGGGIPRLSLQNILLKKITKINQEKFKFFLLPHGYTKTLAFIHEKMGYIIDCERIPAAVIKVFAQAKLNTLIIDCVKKEPHRTHLTWNKTLSYIEQIDAKFSGLTHMGHELEHEQTAKELKKLYGHRVAPLYDGQILSY